MREGDVLAGRYRLARPLKSGARGQVWLAEHLALDGTQVAVKLVDRTWAGDDETHERFKREANAAAALRSPHVVQILDHGVAEGAPFVVMELLEGQTLVERLRKPPRPDLVATQSIITQVARALTKAHAAGIVHRDLRPGHVFLLSDEDEEVVKVLGFGVAATAPGTMSTAPAPALPYQSPEQLKGGEVGPATDLWALGVIAYECIAGKVPFSAIRAGHLLSRLERGEKPSPASRSRPGIPASFDAWFARACALDPAKRFASAREMSDELTEVAREEPSHQPRISSRPPATANVDDAWSEGPPAEMPKIAPAPRVPKFDLPAGGALESPIPKLAPRQPSSPSLLKPATIPPRAQSSPAIGRQQSSPSFSRQPTNPGIGRQQSSPALLKPQTISPRPQSSPAIGRQQSSPSLLKPQTIPPRPQSSPAIVAEALAPNVEAPKEEEKAVVAAPVVEVRAAEEPIEAAPPSSAEVELDEVPASEAPKVDDAPEEAAAAPPKVEAPIEAKPAVVEEAPPVSRPRAPPPPAPQAQPQPRVTVPQPVIDFDAVDVDLPPELDIGRKGRRVRTFAIVGALAAAITIVAVVVVPYLRQEDRPAAAPSAPPPTVAAVEVARPVEAPPQPDVAPSASAAAVDPGLAPSALAEEAKKAAAAASVKKPVFQGGPKRPPREDEVEIPQPDPE